LPFKCDLQRYIEDENTGPLEATIKNMHREIEVKGRESKDLQRWGSARWNQVDP
jgi:hypothetical protein